MWIFGADSPPDPDFAERPAAVILAACSYASQPVAAKGVCRRIEPTSIELALPARQHRGELHARRVPHTNCRPQGSKALAANAPRGAAPDPQWPATCCIVPPSISAVEPRRRYYSRTHIGNAPRSLCSSFARSRVTTPAPLACGRLLWPLCAVVLPALGSAQTVHYAMPGRQAGLSAPTINPAHLRGRTLHDESRSQLPDTRAPRNCLAEGPRVGWRRWCDAAHGRQYDLPIQATVTRVGRGGTPPSRWHDGGRGGPDSRTRSYPYRRAGAGHTPRVQRVVGMRLADSVVRCQRPDGEHLAVKRCRCVPRCAAAPCATSTRPLAQG